MTGMKRCTKCGETKPVAEFSRDRSKRDGLYPWCKECSRAHRRAYYEAHLEEELAKARAYCEAHREERRARERERRALLGNPTPGRWQEITRKHATRSGRWSEAEDRYLSTSTDRAVDDALALGRTYMSVSHRLSCLRARGVPLARDMATV